MRIMYIILIVVMIPAIVIAQEAADSTADTLYNDVIVLDNGGKVRGRIIEGRHEGDKIIIERVDGSIIEIARNRVFHITTAEYGDETQEAILDLLNLPESPAPNPFKYIFAFGIASYDKKAAVALSMIAGGRSKLRTLTGVKLKFDMTQGGLISIGAHMRYHLSDSTETLFPYGEMGLALRTSSSANSAWKQRGIFLAGGIGYRFVQSTDHILQITAGYKRFITTSSGSGSSLGMFSLMFGAII